MGPGDLSVAAGVRREDIPENVRVLGSVPQARSYFSAFDIFALPSRYEGFPYVVLEAMAAHVPIVSTRVSGAAELIEAEQVGFVVPNEDNIAAFTDATITLSQDPALRKLMSRNCERAVRRYSVAAMVDRTVDVYQSLLKECN
jgi:glycosyltransferase involved in cell wall biosynthesis